MKNIKAVLQIFILVLAVLPLMHSIGCNPPPNCGDGNCDFDPQNGGEDLVSCSQDCYVGNGVCEPLENYASAPQDCPQPTCGNGTCDAGETHSTCPYDCFCGNGACDTNENFDVCPEDCQDICGNASCTNDEKLSASFCFSDCCGDGVCTSPIIEEFKTLIVNNADFQNASEGDDVIFHFSQPSAPPVEDNYNCSSDCGNTVNTSMDCDVLGFNCELECGNGTLDGLAKKVQGAPVISYYEQCDDGNNNDGDGCSGYCRKENVCGNHICDPGENGSCTQDCLICGDSVCSSLENANNCPNDCPKCGNGVIQSGESCDDGNTHDGDGCSAVCTVEGGYVCSGSPSICQPPVCGNNMIEVGEGCDDGCMVGYPNDCTESADNGDGCSNKCQIESGYTCSGEPSTCMKLCGNGNSDPGEQCDDGNTVTETTCPSGQTSCDICNSSCISQHLDFSSTICDNDGTCEVADGETGLNCPDDCLCPNNIVDSGESCDDGDLIIGDGCSNCAIEDGWDCTTIILGGVARTVSCELLCGNGNPDPGEACDDDNTMSGDGCDANCTLTACGNGIVTAGEACDDGNNIDGDGCQADCTVANCGNGIQDPGEACDDNNTTSGDGCDANCTSTGCGNGIQTSGEACDDGNTNNHDSCTNNCTVSVCGDGAIQTGLEECDDGNTSPNDGCSASCAIESGYSCSGEPSGCVSAACSAPDNNDIIQNATNLGTAPLGNPFVSGAMCPGDGVDYYKFQTLTSADFVIKLTPKQALPVNGFIQLGFHLSNGTLVDADNLDSSESSAGLSVRFGFNQLPAGTYYISVDGNTIADNASIPYDLEIYALSCPPGAAVNTQFLDTNDIQISKSFCNFQDQFVFNVEHDGSTIDISVKITGGAAIGLTSDGNDKFPLVPLPPDFIRAALQIAGTGYQDYAATSFPRDTNGDLIPDEVHITYNNAKAGNYILIINQNNTVHNALTYLLNYDLNGTITPGAPQGFYTQNTYTWTQGAGACTSQQGGGIATLNFNDFTGLDDIAGDGKLTLTMKGDTHSPNVSSFYKYDVSVGYNSFFGFVSIVDEHVQAFVVNSQSGTQCGEISKSFVIPEYALRFAIPTLPNGPGLLIVKVTPSNDVDCSCSENSVTALLEIPEVMVCGDGVVREGDCFSTYTGEACDDGNTANSDGCSNTCEVETGWSCSGDPSTCQNLAGNGQCDFGETTVTTPADCPANTCGNHICEPGETSGSCQSDCLLYDVCCDFDDTGCVTSEISTYPPSAWSCGGRNDCSTGLISECGNRFCEDSEDAASCPGDCVVDACGNGIVEIGEGCDDGANSAGDGCDSSCFVEYGYQCTGEPSTCNTVCGNGIQTPDEACDDGNSNDNDGCSSSCAVEPGFNCFGTYCIPICGNSDIQTGETCDDGNTVDGDGCASYCQLESSYCCAGEPSTCVNDGGTNSCGTCGDGICNSSMEYFTCNQDCQ